MSAPLAKGIIIAASIVVAAGIAVYENDQIRQWIEEYRRRIAIALYDLGDNIGPESSNTSPEERAEINRQRRLDIVRRNRAALIRRAREEGIAVDLDELSALGQPEMEQRRPSNTSFDDLVTDDGKLRSPTEVSKASGSEATTSSMNPFTLRQRGAGARGLAAGLAFANPFDDEAQLLVDRDLIAPSESEVPASMRSMSPRPASIVPTIIDIPIMDSSTPTHEQPQYKTDDELDAEIEEAIRRSLQESTATSETSSVFESPLPTTATLSRSTTEDLAGLDDSLYALPSPRPMSVTQTPAPPTLSLGPAFLGPIHVEDGTQTPRTSNPLTPTSDVAAFSSALSAALPASTTVADDEETHSLMSDEDMFDARSEAAESEGFSLVGASTPGSWTDVDTDGEGEEGNGARAAGH